MIIVNIGMSRKLVLHQWVFSVKREKGYIIYTDGKVETFYPTNDEEFDFDELKTIIKDLGYIKKFPENYVLHFKAWNKTFDDFFCGGL